MSTVNKQIADDIITGLYEEDQCIKIVKYTNAFNGDDAYGCIFEGQDLNKYAASEYIINPVTYWEFKNET